MKHTIQIEAMHGLRIGELLELEQKISSFDMDKLVNRPDLQKGLNAGTEGGDYEEAPYQVINGIAIININGPLLSTPTFFSKWLGYASYPDIRAWVMQAAKDPGVEDILLMIGSPGGSVFGITDGAEAIKRVNAIKPVYVYTNKNCCSGAYWLASAAKEILASPESETGSIGVIVTHASYEKQLEDDGVKITVIRSSELKAIGGPYKDLTDKEISHIQEQVDTFNGLFQNQVQTSRPQVKFSAMNGQTFIGADAQRQGLVDRVCSYDDAIAHIQAKRPKTTALGGLGMKMTSAELQVALDAGKSLEDMGLTAEEATQIMAAGMPETEAQDTEIKDLESGEGEGSDVTVQDVEMLTAQNTELINALAGKHAEILELQAKLTAAEAKVADPEMLSIIGDVFNNRRIAMGMPRIDVSAFSATMLMADFKAITDQYNAAFVTGGMFQKKEAPKPVSVAKDSVQAGLMQAAAQ